MDFMELMFSGVIIIVVFMVLAILFVVMVVVIGELGHPMMKYGTGQTTGIVTTVEQGLFWDMVWIRASDSTSQTDGYYLRKTDTRLRYFYEGMAGSGERGTFVFGKYFFGGDVLEENRK